MISTSSDVCSSEPANTEPTAAGGNVLPSKGRHRTTDFFVLLILAITALPFLPALRYGFVYDDDVQVVDTVAVRGAQSPTDYFLTSVWTLRHSAIPLNYNYYRPLFASWLRVNAAAFGLHSFPWHLSALCIHLAVTVLVFFLLRRHLHDSWMALAGSLVFGLHPVHIESVAWISGVTDPLAALGILGSFLLWQRKMEMPRLGLFIGSLACYTAALLCKETSVVLPAIIFAYVVLGISGSEEASPGNWGRVKIAVREILPFAAITLVYFGVRVAVLQSVRGGSVPWLPRSAVLLTAPSAFLFYLRQLAWPGGLRLFYDFVPVLSAGSARFWVPLTILATAGCALLVWRRRLGKVIPAAAVWLVLPLLPVLDINLFYRDDFLHDRYLYLPSIGFALLCGLAVQKIYGQNPGPQRRLGVLAGVTLLTSCLAVSTAIQSAPWRDNLSLYSSAALHSTNTMARVNLASEYAKRGRLEEARQILQKVIEERPAFWLVNYNLGYVSYRLNDFATAEQFLRRAIAINPGEGDAYTYLGLTFFRENRLDEAASELSEAIARNPQGQGYHFAFGIVLRQLGQFDAANREFEQELRNHPENEVLRAQVSAMERNSTSNPAQPR